MDDRYALARRAFDKDYTRILSAAKAHKDLASYNRIHTSISVNKMIDYAIVPLTVLGVAGAHFKFPGQMIERRNQVCMVVGGLALVVAQSAESHHFKPVFF